MQNDLISRSALKKKLQAHHEFFVNAYGGFSNLPQKYKARVDEITNCIAAVANAPAVDAVVLPKGRPGDYLEWDNGTGHRQVYGISSVMICEGCMRYGLATFAPVVGHPGIVRILSREEAEKLAKERMEKEPCVTVEAKTEG